MASPITRGSHIQFVTGRLAEQAVRLIVSKLASELHFTASVSVLPITVAALITSKWLLRHLQVLPAVDRVILPGHLSAEIESIRSQLGHRVECGPRDIRDLPLFFGQNVSPADDYGESNIEIIAEINHAPSLDMEELVTRARELANQGADIIDLGCTPGHRWLAVADAVKRLRDENLRVSIDSFDHQEVSRACSAGAELVLSVNSSNRAAAVDWDTEVVVIPDDPSQEKSFEETENFLRQRRIPMRLDPILEPIGCGFAQSLARYMRCRERYPDSKMMMGIGNITELTDADSAGINVLLLGICEELQIQSVLTTAVINWARTSVQECKLARQLVHYACQHRVPAKHIESNLVTLRDPRVKEYDLEILDSLARSIRDNNFRIYTRDDQIHAISAGIHEVDRDPFVLMERILTGPGGDRITASHAFYLGFEMAKAVTANTLSKHYEQDQALNWGYLTRSETSHRLSK
ncbi:MAG: dihydropteroate synthase [Planctomycetales bacterium]|nr:dihydropteroate synthase [Planctomycetales bacterium]